MKKRKRKNRIENNKTIIKEYKTKNYNQNKKETQ